MKNSFALVISITVLLLTVIFTLQNARIVQVKLLFWNMEASLSLILFITLSIGVISAVIALLPVILNLTSINKKLLKGNEELKKLEKPTYIKAEA